MCINVNVITICNDEHHCTESIFTLCGLECEVVELNFHVGTFQPSRFFGLTCVIVLNAKNQNDSIVGLWYDGMMMRNIAQDVSLRA